MLKLISLFGLLLCLGVACSSGSDDEIHEPPQFKSSTPENGAINVAVESKIEVSFDEVISINNQSDITINGRLANVKASFTKLVFTEVLQEEITYTIVVPKGAVRNTFGILLQNEVKIFFTTEDDPNISIAEQLVTENPTSQAVKVYDFLKKSYGINTISAVMSNGAMDTNEAEWVNQHTGKYPAMLGIDYIFLNWSPANWIDYNNIDVIKDWWRDNGLVTASWHWNVPPNESITDISHFSFYTTKEIDGVDVKVEFKPSNVPIEGTWENRIAKADFDELIEYIKLLQTENIPLIWRPLHEASGNIYEYNNRKAWFWWGMEGGDAYVALWRYMFNYFKAKGVNNLIWVWTTQTKDQDFYPGDEYVDIIGKDVYDNGDEEGLARMFKSIQETYPSKIITLSECGNVANLSGQWNKGGKWSWFMPWCDHDRTDNIDEPDFTSTDHQFANAAWWLDATRLDEVITRDEMPDLK